MTQIIDPICEYRTNPLGIDVTAPRFGWKLKTDKQGAHQTAYQILVATTPALLSDSNADLWNTGKIESDQSIHIPYDGKALSSRQRAYWKVIVWDDENSADDSEVSWFEIGLLDRDDWQAQWIGGSLKGGPSSTIPSPYLRKDFSLSSDVQSARLYITALGLFECTINGKAVTDDIFQPGWTDYHKRIQYNVYDVTDTLQAGENAIGTILGDGWASGHIGIGTTSRQTYVDRPRLFAQLEVTLTDGSIQTIVTDDSWKHIYGAQLESDIIMGESYDARLEMSGWDTVKFDDSDWSSALIFEDIGAQLVATNGPTVKRIEELKPISDPIGSFNPISPRYTFDMGQNMVGRIRFKGSAPAGTTVRFRYAEVLDAEDKIYTDNLRDARVTDHYTFKGDGEEVWEPKFTFHGFRYVELAGYRGEVSDDTVIGIVIHSDMEQTGTFECSDPLINQLQHNIQWGQKGNFVDVPTDCPQRDERLGWTGDIQVFARTAAFNMNVAGFMTKWANDVADSQSDTGSIPAVVPLTIPLVDGGPAWADAAIICPWTMYLCYGDKRILAENYTVMTRFMDFMLAGSPNLIRCAPDFEGWMGFGDWLSIDADTPRDLIGTAFLAYDADLMAQIASILGKDEDAAKYRQLFADVKTAFQNRYLAGNELPEDYKHTASDDMLAGANSLSQGNRKQTDYGSIESEVFNIDLFTPTQTSYVLALHFNLLPDELCPLAEAELVADIDRRNMHLSTGFVGAPYLPHVLSNNNQLDYAYTLLNQQTWPSWLYSVTQGATTIWERWDGWTEENGFQDTEMNSFNHYAYGSIGAWLYNTVAGIEIDPSTPAYKHSILRPQPGGGLTHATGKIKTLYGELVSSWEIDGDTFKWTVTIPPNTTATAHIPESFGSNILLNDEAIEGSTTELKAGTYHFVAQ